MAYLASASNAWIVFFIILLIAMYFVFGRTPIGSGGPVFSFGPIPQIVAGIGATGWLILAFGFIQSADESFRSVFARDGVVLANDLSSPLKLRGVHLAINVFSSFVPVFAFVGVPLTLIKVDKHLSAGRRWWLRVLGALSIGSLIVFIIVMIILASIPNLLSRFFSVGIAIAIVVFALLHFALHMAFTIVADQIILKLIDAERQTQIQDANKQTLTCDADESESEFETCE